MKKALFKFSINSSLKEQQSRELEILVPLNPSKKVDPEVRISQETKFIPVDENGQLLKHVSILKFGIRIYSDYTILNKDTYYESFNVEMNKDKPNELCISPCCAFDSVYLKPIKIVEE